MFSVGQKVECVNDRQNQGLTPWLIRPGSTMDGLMNGEVYTIRAVGEFRGVALVWLHEIVREDCGVNGECGFHPSRFRPVQGRKTDIGFAHEILRKATKRKPATV